MNDVVSQAGKQTAQQEEGDADSPRGRGRGAPPVLPSLLWDLTRSQLLEPTLAEDLVQFSMISVSVVCALRCGPMIPCGGHVSPQQPPHVLHHCEITSVVRLNNLISSSYMPPLASVVCSWPGCSTCYPAARSTPSPPSPSTRSRGR